MGPTITPYYGRAAGAARPPAPGRLPAPGISRHILTPLRGLLRVDIACSPPPEMSMIAIRAAKAATVAAIALFASFVTFGN